MSIIEAIKSGKPFKRTGSACWIGRFADFSTEDIIADDWEIKQEPAEQSPDEIIHVREIFGMSDAVTKKLDQLQTKLDQSGFASEYPMQALINVARAAQKRIFLGHNNPCDSLLKYRDCNCGHADLEKALKKLGEL